MRNVRIVRKNERSMQSLSQVSVWRLSTWQSIHQSLYLNFFATHLTLVSRLWWGASEEIKEISQRETKDQQVITTSKKRSCAVCLWNRWWFIIVLQSQFTSLNNKGNVFSDIHFLIFTMDIYLICCQSHHLISRAHKTWVFVIMWIHLEKVLLIGYFCSLVVDSDSDNFESLKKVSKTKQNDTSKPTKTDAESPRSGSKPLVKPSSTQEKKGVRSPPKPVTPKSAPPPQPKKTPTSVFDYFGSGTIQRSDKKLVASTKRKAVSTDKQSCTASVSKPSGPGLCYK